MLILHPSATASPMVQNCSSRQARLSTCQQSLWQSMAVGPEPVANMCPKKQLPLGCVTAHSSTLGSNQAVPAPNVPQPEEGGVGAPCSWAGGVEPRRGPPAAPVKRQSCFCWGLDAESSRHC